MFTQEQEQFIRMLIKEDFKNAIKEAIKEVKEEERRAFIDYNKEVSDMYGTIFEAQQETK